MPPTKTRRRFALPHHMELDHATRMEHIEADALVGKFSHPLDVLWLCSTVLNLSGMIVQITEEDGS